MKIVVLSASCMTDMVRFYQEQLIMEVRRRIANGEKIHTLVIWTKHPRYLFCEPLYSFLLELRNSGIQLYLHLTITGMGGRIMGMTIDGKEIAMEPNGPRYEDSLGTIPDVISLLGDPRRLMLRIDPIIYYKDATGKFWSNEDMIEPIVESCAKHGVSTFRFSFVGDGGQKKVERRFAKLGYSLLIPDDAKRESFKQDMYRIMAQYNVKICACATPGFEETSCIDGRLLTELHDQHLQAPLESGSKRPHCGCTKSIDIGGWPPKKCNSGCQYCYARSSYE